MVLTPFSFHLIKQTNKLFLLEIISQSPVPAIYREFLRTIRRSHLPLSCLSTDKQEKPIIISKRVQEGNNNQRTMTHILGDVDIHFFPLQQQFHDLRPTRPSRSIQGSLTTLLYE
jgi:hypothetical protein